MPIIVINGLCGAGGGLVRSIYGWCTKEKRDKFSWRRLGGSIISGFVAGMAAPEPITAAALGWAGSEAIHKARRKLEARHFPTR